MNGGHIEQIGRPLELYDNPQNTFVAAFIGSPAMNLLNGRFDSADGKPVFKTNEGIVLPLLADAPVLTGLEGVYGIRPEYFTLWPETVGIPARVVVVEPLGSETHVTATVGEQTIVTVFHDRLGIEPEETIWLQPRTDRICLFDADGKRLAGKAAERNLQHS
jgi:multiple sugar transport system ATP-binding protein